MKAMGRNFLVIPTYNEVRNIGRLLAELFSLYGDLTIIVVDDNSPDGTGDILEKLKKKYKRLQVIHRKGKLGLGTAYAEGFKKALAQKARVIGAMDADFSHQPKELGRLWQESKGAELVIGSRYTPGGAIQNWEWHRLFLSKVANWFVRLYLGLPVSDATSGYRVYQSRFLKTLDLNSILATGYAFQVQMTNFAKKAGFRIKEVPITFWGRELGETKVSWREILKSIYHVLQMPFQKIPLTLKERLPNLRKLSE